MLTDQLLYLNQYINLFMVVTICNTSQCHRIIHILFLILIPEFRVPNYLKAKKMRNKLNDKEFELWRLIN